LEDSPSETNEDGRFGVGGFPAESMHLV
jgi:hypothetical protein